MKPAGSCRVCGAGLHKPSPLLLEDLGVAWLPSWLDGLCFTCLRDLSGTLPQDRDGYRLRGVRVDDVAAFLAVRLELLARRVADGRSILRCEAIRGGFFRGDPGDLRCRSFATRRHEGHDLCWGCQSRALRGGGSITLSGQPARAFVIWASSPVELVRRACDHSAKWHREIKQEAA